MPSSFLVRTIHVASKRIQSSLFLWAIISKCCCGKCCIRNPPFGFGWRLQLAELPLLEPLSLSSDGWLTEMVGIKGRQKEVWCWGAGAGWGWGVMCRGEGWRASEPQVLWQWVSAFGVALRPQGPSRGYCVGTCTPSTEADLLGLTLDWEGALSRIPGLWTTLEKLPGGTGRLLSSTSGFFVRKQRIPGPTTVFWGLHLLNLLLWLVNHLALIVLWRH